ncbi:MAG: exopolysaccharide biosynthesis polyprenyl glycosylphosphotransferase [Acidimicrobiales bacterium]|nr:exopolysaccharide biosynthesis polyprenyl glycosylphosphotransferase [Acidimicrobiales bacterium]
MALSPRWLLYAATVAAVLGFAKLHAARFGHYDIIDSGRLPWLLLYAALLILTAYGAGLPDGNPSRGSRSALATAFAATAAAAVAVSALQFAAGGIELPRFVVLASAAVLVPVYATLTLFAGDEGARQEARALVVVVGAHADTLALIEDLHRDPEKRARVVWTLDPDEVSRDGPEDVSVLDAAINTKATVVLLSQDAQANPDVVRQAAELHARGVRIRTLTDFYDQWLGKLPIGELERASLLFDVREVHDSVYARAKRLVDLAGALVGLPVLLALIPVVWLANLVGNRGPLLYRQERTGKDGVTFRIIKFRTMRPSTSTVGTWTTNDDPRITPVGKWLRLTHLDEAPQLVNILRGDLSFVGPRPEQPHYVDELVEKIPFYALRHLVRPGLTGWAQVKYAYGATELDALEKLQYEFYYLRHQSLTLDARILGRTVRDVLGRAGR